MQFKHKLKSLAFFPSTQRENAQCQVEIRIILFWIKIDGTVCLLYKFQEVDICSLFFQTIFLNPKNVVDPVDQ